MTRMMTSMSPIDIVYLRCNTKPNIEPLRTPTVERLIGLFCGWRTVKGAIRESPELLLLDGNAALADVDLYAGCLLSLLIELIA